MSQANYIIICDAQLQSMATNEPVQQFLIASRCAAAVVNNLSVRFPALSQADVQPISDLLHGAMHVMEDKHSRKNLPNAEALFDLLDALSEKFEGPD